MIDSLRPAAGTANERAAANEPSNWVVPLIYTLFFISGASSLIYQVVWIRKFGLVMGGTIFSMSVVVSTFMAGLAVGAAALGRMADRVRNPLALYAVIELGIAACALILNITDGVRARMVSALIDTPNLSGTLLVRIAIAVLWLGPPCFLIGGTLPVMVRVVVRRLAVLGQRVGALYFVNTLGAAAGALFSGFLLIGWLGLTGATLVAMAINVVVAGSSLALARFRGPDSDSAAAPAAEPDVGAIRFNAVVVPAAAFFLSGFCSLVLEMAWTRLVLGFLLSGALVISINLSALLVGFAIGGVAVAKLADTTQAPARLASLLFALTATLALVGLNSVELLGLLPPASYVPSVSHVAAVLGLLLPASISMGATFPVLVRILVTSRGRLGTQLGGYYALNTIGAVLGGIVAPFVLVPAIGTSLTVILAVALQLAVAAALFATSGGATHRVLRYGPPALAAVSALLIPANWDVYHRTLSAQAAALFPNWSDERAHIEGADSTVVLYEVNQSSRTQGSDTNRYRIQVNASQLVAFDTNETKLMAHLPLLAAEKAQRALVICFGVGNTFRSALSHGIDVDVVDINPAVPDLARIHQKDPARTFDNPRGHIYINDGRNFLQVTRNQYDMVTIDPAPPIWQLGMGNIQSKEFYQLVADRLTPTGVAEAWMLADPTPDFLRTLAAFRAVFPHVAVFRGARYAAYHVLGSKSPIRISDARLQALFADPLILRDMGETEMRFFSADLIRSLYVTDEAGVDSAIAGVEPLVDDRPVLEYRWLGAAEVRAFTFPRELVRPLALAP